MKKERQIKTKKMKRKAKKTFEGRVKVRKQSRKRPINRRAKEIVLDDEMLAQMILLWRYGVTDDRIALILGINKFTLSRWLTENRPLEVTVEGLDGKEIHKMTVGLKDLKEHEKENLRVNYIQRLEGFIEAAKKDRDYKVASLNLRWLMEKMFPRHFGDPRYQVEKEGQPKRICFPLKPPDG